MLSYRLECQKILVLHTTTTPQEWYLFVLSDYCTKCMWICIYICTCTHMHASAWITDCHSYLQFHIALRAMVVVVSMPQQQQQYVVGDKYVTHYIYKQMIRSINNHMNSLQGPLSVRIIAFAVPMKWRPISVIWT